MRYRGHLEYGDFLDEIGRVTDADFEVIEPTTSNNEHRDEIAGDGNPYPGPTSGTATRTTEG